MITTVTFDFWETLVQDTRENLRAQRDLRIAALGETLARAGRPLPPPAVAAAYDASEAVLRQRFWDHHRDPSYHEQVRLVLECIAPGVADTLPAGLLEETVEAYISPVLRLPPSLQPGAPEAIRELAGRGLRLGIISNTGRTPGVVLRRILAAHDLLRHFAVVSYSDEVGYRKPGPEIFVRTLALADARPAEAAHVGDSPLDDVTGAQGVGMRGIHYAAAGRAPAPHADLVVTALGELPDRLSSLSRRAG